MDVEWLQELGVERLDQRDVAHALTTVRSRLEMAVGTRLAAAMTEAQLDEFGSLVDDGDPEAATAWLDREVPDHRRIVREELALLETTIMGDPAAFARAVRTSAMEACW